ncbi:hypothetical protein ON010_g13844 [Phytophthora cinnamomi]|nr:hypothetical protein ON010_g13844 [Phytophthora cinnamomi]
MSKDEPKSNNAHHGAGRDDGLGRPLVAHGVDLALRELDGCALGLVALDKRDVDDEDGEGRLAEHMLNAALVDGADICVVRAGCVGKRRPDLDGVQTQQGRHRITKIDAGQGVRQRRCALK